MTKNRFAVFILTHGRPDNVITVNTLKRHGYTGEMYIVIDNEDATADKYREIYGDKVIQFDKLAVSKYIDPADMARDRRTIVYARNACFDIAEKMGIDYFLELDDDYRDFQSRYIQDGKLKGQYIYPLDKLFPHMVDFLETSGALTVAFTQGGDFIGGKGNQRLRERLLRKAMNTFFCKTERRFDFLGRVNEDVNTYTYLGSTGKLFMSIIDCMITQKTTQQNSGGMTEMYLDSGTYVKSFYSVIFMPSAVQIGVLQSTFRRIHHMVKWENCVPKILSQEHKKGEHNYDRAEEDGQTDQTDARDPKEDR